MCTARPPCPPQVGDSSQVGACRMSCKVCEECALHDRECYNRNRTKLGYLAYTPEELGVDLAALGRNYDDGTL